MSTSVSKGVLCEVDNCTYWGSGNKCNVDAIYVVSHKGKQAFNNEETECKTFKPEVNFYRG
ncbi:DUF1540 domain-containing protein [Peribacillus butanolivorans]